jgi:hypothetical protein
LSLLLCASLAFASNYGVVGDREVKQSYPMGEQNPMPQVGGEDIATATPIPALPYTDGGNTCGYLDNYDEVCPFTGSTSPDVVYSYTPAVDGLVNLYLCDSYYDTKMYIYENTYTPGFPYACNDDACSGPNFPFSWLSALEGVPVVAGNTYYIVVDGYGGDCGEYIFQMEEDVPCVVECPSGALVEGEPDCFDNYVDTYNGGCNSTPFVFQNLDCSPTGITMCGTYGGFLFNGLSYRDTDWYQLDVPTGGFASVTVCVEGEHPTALAILDGNFGCSSITAIDFQVTGDCDPLCMTWPLPAGPMWFFVATDGFGTDFACGADYVLTIDGLDCPVSVEPTSWSRIKAQYGQ